MASPHIAGPCGAHQERQPRLVAHGDQVGDHDHRVPDRHRGRTDRARGRRRRRHAVPGPVRDTSTAGPMFDPGLVYDSDATDWIRYGCAIGQFQEVAPADTCETAEADHGALDPSDLNYPSIAVGDLTGNQTITRTVTNVDDAVSIYPDRRSPLGFKVKVDLRKLLVVQTGATATYSVTVTRKDAAGDEWSFGSLTWSDLLGHEVRSPITAAREWTSPSRVRSSVKALTARPSSTVRTGMRRHDRSGRLRPDRLGHPDTHPVRVPEPLRRSRLATRSNASRPRPSSSPSRTMPRWEASRRSTPTRDRRSTSISTSIQKLDDGSLELFDTPPGAAGLGRGRRPGGGSDVHGLRRSLGRPDRCRRGPGPHLGRTRSGRRGT